MVRNTPLDKIDPQWAWQPWKPDARQPFDLKWAAHLYRRAGFGVSLGEARKAVRQGFTRTLERLLQGEPKAERLHDFLMRTGERIAHTDVNSLRNWWLYCMLHSRHPLREKMTLFWHNHFATSIAKVQRTTMMFQQNRLLRQHALGTFPPFLLAISKDPAMLVWLDSNSNIKGRPNENYAREVMELFSLGVGNYTEQDIREAARAFTGWHTNGDAYEYNPRFHDDGMKTVLGKTGNWNGQDIVKLVLQQPVAARFLTRKLFRFFISEAQEPTDRLIEQLADDFRQSGYDIARLVRTMLSSQLFFSEHAFRQKINSPVEYVLGAVHGVVAGTIPQRALVPWINRMGQQLFAPPNVKGWREGDAWLTTSTMLVRHNFAQELAMGTLWGRASRVQPTNVPPPPHGKKAPEEPAPEQRFDPARILTTEKVTKPEAIVQTLLDTHIPGGTRPAARAKLIAFVAEGNPSAKRLPRRVRETVHAILSMPEAQLS